MNNYDKSSSGENIEMNLHYSTDLAQIFFDDWVAGCTGENVTKISLTRDDYIYLVGDPEKPIYKKSELAKMPKTHIFDLWLNYEFGYGVEINDYKKSEFINDLLTVTIKRYYEYIANELSWHNVSNSFLHDYFITRGYSQGDAVYIVRLESAIDKDFRQYIDHLFWDCPISGSVIVNDEEFYFDELLYDYYVYDKDQLIEKINNLDISDYAKNWIIEHLPEYPGYI